MYLKRIEAHGFKSFADKVNIQFEKGITGIVGPNGCGKSNISDGIRWVLGEQSAKSLRGSSMSDVIFAGSEDRKALNMAEVTLVFDNSDHYLKMDFNEIEITRRLYRATGEGEYLINKQPCRLKDIVDLIMDTGLGKDSLSIISQGNVASFADAKPIERRAIFEEAAGVSKYKKRKIESLSKLERTNNNLERVNDIVYELEKQIGPLKKQAEKAKIYLEKKDELKNIEVSVIVFEITKYSNILKEAKKNLEQLNIDKIQAEGIISQNDMQIVELKNEMINLDKFIHAKQEELLGIINEIQNHEAEKIQIDEKRKHVINSENSSNSDRISNLKALIEENLVEYRNRSNRLEQGKIIVGNLTTKKQNLIGMLDHAKDMLQDKDRILNKINNRYELLKNLIDNRSNSQGAIRQILAAKRSLHGIEGVLADLITPKSGKENAVSAAIGGALYNIVCIDEEDARDAINFLKRNEAGRATFLPISVLQKRSVKEEHLLALKTISGFEGVCSEFVFYEEKYQKVIDSLLNNVLICADLKSANECARLTKYSYKIVTIDGDIVHRGGSMTGGKIRNQDSTFLQKKELEEIEEQKPLLSDEISKYQQSIVNLTQEIAAIDHDVVQKQIALGQLEQIIAAKKSKLEILQAEYEDLTDEKYKIDEEDLNFETSLIERLNEAYAQRDELTTLIKSSREKRMSCLSKSEELDRISRQYKREVNSISNHIYNISIDVAKKETELDNLLQRLNSEYKMTYEFASQNINNDIDIESSKNIVFELRRDIEKLGYVNVDAIKDYEEIKERHDFLVAQKEELIEARDKMLKAIDEMDETMKTQFIDVFNQINKKFHDTFRRLFGGGRASLILSDPNDILETGIDIDIQPPGKAVQNIRLFSGGEKSLIALSVLFSILEVRPTPLCILDEVEAALDPANVDRFASFLKEFSKDTQFIVVTHRAGTMEKCDLLYGVTMQQKGVTKMISVKIEEAIDMSKVDEE